MDTTNAGALDCYREVSGVTPNLALLAAESVVYEQARTVAPLTLPAHASMLTGLYPPRHGVRDNGLESLPGSALTLAERARAAGMETAAFLSASVLAAPYGLDQGFDVYDAPGEHVTSGQRPITERDSREVTGAVERWLRGRDRERRFFLWVHYFDPHHPYRPAPEYLERSRGDPYLGEVAAIDESVGRLVETLREVGALDESVIVILADHGEALGRNDEPTHSIYCYDTTLRVPMLVRDPGGHGAGTRSAAPVSVVDVFPTLVDALGLGEHGDVDGESLYRREPTPERGVYFESYAGYLSYAWSPLAGWVRDGVKYVHGSRPRVFDLSGDPGETRDIGGDRPEAVAAAREAIRALAARPSLTREDESRIDEDMRDQVRALGYAAMAEPGTAIPHPLAESDLPDPHERKQEFAAINGALALAGAGKRGEAIEILGKLLDASPGNPTLHLHLGSMLCQEERHAEAAVIFERLLALAPNLPKQQEGWVHGYLGSRNESEGRLEEAARHYERGLELDPGHEERKNRLARVLRALGRE